MSTMGPGDLGSRTDFTGPAASSDEVLTTTPVVLFQRSRFQALSNLLLFLLAVKFVFYFLDSRPKFLLGDSRSYLWTALTGWIPDDRSFVFGFLLQPLTVWPHSFTPFVVFQVFISGVTAWLLGLCLIRYFSVRLRWAAACAFLCAVEPLQLISERFVLTEAVSTFLFVCCMVLALGYLKSGRLIYLVFLEIISIPLISIRVSFLPFVLAGSVLFPVLGPPAVTLWRAIFRRARFKEGMAKDAVLSRTGTVVLHLFVAVLLSQALLYGYRRWNGHLLGRPAAYLYTDGFMLAADWAPVIRPIDFPFAELRQPIFDGVKIDLHDPKARNAQLFAEGGLIPVLRSFVKDQFLANKLAKKMALRAAKRDPIAVLKLGATTYGSFFDTKYLAYTVGVEEGFGNGEAREQRWIQELATNFNEQFDGIHIYSLTQKWHAAALPWYKFLMIAPVVVVLLAPFTEKAYWPQWVVMCLFNCMFVGVAVFATQEPTVRYLVADAWLTILSLGALASSVGRRWAGR